MLCCFGGSAARRQHRDQQRQTASQIDPLVLEPETLTIEITPDTVPPPTPAHAPPKPARSRSTRRPPSPTDPILPGVRRPSESGSGRSSRRPGTDNSIAYPPTPSMSPRSARAPGSPPQPSSLPEQGPRVISYHRPGANSAADKRPGSARSPTSNSSVTNSQTTTHTQTTGTSPVGRTLRGPSTDEKRGGRKARKQASTPQLGGRDRSDSNQTRSTTQRPPTAPTPSLPSTRAQQSQHVHHARSYSSLGTASSQITSPSSVPPALPFTTPSLPPFAPSSPLMGANDWFSHSGMSPVIRPSAAPIVVNSVRTTTSRTPPHIDLLTGMVSRQDPPPRYEAG
ncbi:hypothetical protein EXIGLDRAFT_744257 [Exidia glandulosa HHB12029]|uniref:Uncharacterized protein n=1 Tax=Exidia glandulosa HHB12029 TaxID=1314781 RepID=A0A165Q4W6_EXIGL|nr:hypothetical protein EXIGLDRAFT_744257 [Exidia glandulosa HHB12029]